MRINREQTKGDRVELDRNGMPVTPALSPAKAPVSPAKAKIGGALVILIGLTMGYFFILRPLQEANRTGHLVYYIKAILLVPAFLYMGVAAMITDMRDGQTRETGPDGKARLTTKGKWFIGGFAVVMVLSVAGWYWYLHLIGFISEP